MANNESYGVAGGQTLNVAAPGVLGNDTDADGNPLTAVLVSGPSNGTLTLNANGSFSYTSNANFGGTETFTYRAKDSTLLQSNVATVTIAVNLLVNLTDTTVANFNAGSPGATITAGRSFTRPPAERPSAPIIAHGETDAPKD